MKEDIKKDIARSIEACRQLAKGERLFRNNVQALVWDGTADRLAGFLEAGWTKCDCHNPSGNVDSIDICCDCGGYIS